jgi:AcrR family transcriptional regulator
VSDQAASSNASKLEREVPAIRARIAYLSRDRDALIGEKRKRLEERLWLYHDGNVADYWETIEAEARDKKGEVVISADGQPKTRKITRMKDISQLTPEQQLRIESIHVNEAGIASPKLYSASWANGELRKFHSMGAQASEDNGVQRLSDAELIAQLANQAVKVVSVSIAPDSNLSLEKGTTKMTRPSDITRERILKAAQSLFADHGYKDTSVRAVITKARVNQAAINYHFGGKDGLYREVLRAAIRALTEHQIAHAEEMKGLPREEALAEFIKYQLRPLTARDQINRHYRIINWETLRPTVVYRKLVSEEATPFLDLALDLMRRFMPKADQSTLMMAAIWLMGQCAVFIRHREQLANPPVSLDLNEVAVERLTKLVSSWVLTGLERASQ